MVLEGESAWIAGRRACQGSPGWEACPVLEIDFLGGTPAGICGLEEVLRPDYLAFEERCQGWMVVGEACNVTLGQRPKSMYWLPWKAYLVFSNNRTGSFQPCLHL